MSERIQKVLARAGVASRRQVETWIREGRLAINGVPAALGAHVGPRDRITLDGRPLRIREPDSDTRVVLYHRAARRAPADLADSPGVQDDSEESAHSPTPPDFSLQLPKRAGRRWIPISPLPPNDGGLEVLTSDGELAQRLMRSFSGLDVEFALRVRGEPGRDQLERLQSGLVDEDTQLEVRTVEAAGGEGFNRWLRMVTRGGRARDVHRLCAAAGVELSRLIRVSLGPLKMDRSLARERVRPLTALEMARLYEIAGLERGDERKAERRRTPKNRSKKSPETSKGRRDASVRRTPRHTPPQSRSKRR